VKYRTSLLVILTICLSAVTHVQAQTSTTSSISVEHPWARATPAGAKTGAAYLTLVNNGTSADRLIHASTPMAEKVQVHQEIDENGVMKMRELPVVEIGPGAALTFKPGGTHMMIIGLKQPLKKGQTFPLTLDFEKAGKIDLQIPIAKAGAMGDHDMSGM
jgi:periplasmic copper chaperone A